MPDESGAKPSDTSGVDYVQTMPRPIPIQKVVKLTMWPCHTCKKHTRSHRYSDGKGNHIYLCHGCYSKMSDEELNEWKEKNGIKDVYPMR